MTRTVIENCVAKLVRQGKIKQAVADEALAIHGGMVGVIGGKLSPLQSEALAALETAKLMADRAAEGKASLAKQALAATAAVERVTTHKAGSAAGLMAELTTDIRGGAREANVEDASAAITDDLMREFKAGAEAMRTRWFGLVQDQAVIDRWIDEVFGVSTGDAVAAAAAKGWKAAVELGVRLARSAGKVFSVLDDWRFMQQWEAGRLTQLGVDAFIADMTRFASAGALRLMDPERGLPVDPAEWSSRLRAMFDAVTKEGAAGAKSAFNPKMRIVRFAEGQAGADAFKFLQGKYGSGRDFYAAATRHLASMAREIAFMNTLGPHYRATFNQLRDIVRADEDARKVPRTIARTFGFESSYAAERTMRVLTGEANAVQSEFWAGIGGGVRSTLRAAQLGSAVVSSVFGDSVTAHLAARWNGISSLRVLARALDVIVKDNPEMRADLARLGITAYAVSDSLAGQARYLDETFGSSLANAFRGGDNVPAARRFAELASGAAQFVIRVQGLQAWTEAMKRAFSMEFLAFVAQQKARRLADVDPPFRSFLERHGISAGEWDTIRRAADVEVQGARFFDTESIPDERLRLRFLAAMIGERRYAILEPNARSTQAMTQALPRGSFAREALDGTMAYKSFPVLMMLFHGARGFAAGDGAPVNRLAYFAQLALFGSFAGAAAIQAKSILQGRDPRPMDSGSFWMAAFAQGGGLGIFGDLLYQGITRGGGGFVATAVGPIGSFAEQVGNLVFAPTRALVGDEPNVGTALVRLLKSNTPGSSLWFGRLVIERAIWDQLTRLLEGTDYEAARQRSMRAIERDYRQAYWWPPGTSPQRAPNIAAAVGVGAPRP